MKLFDHPLSPYAMKVRAVLYEKGIDFEKREIQSESQRDELLRLNPRAEVPALVDGEDVIYDSKVIVQYIEERFPEPALMPKDPVARAECRNLELMADTQVDAAVIAFSLFKFFRPGLEKEYPDALSRSQEYVRDLFATLDERLKGSDYFLGEFGLADLAFAPHLGTCAFLGLPPGADTPHLKAWLERMNARESMQRTTQEAIASLNQPNDEPFFDHQRLQWRSDRMEQLVRVGLGGWLMDELEANRAFLPPMP